MKKTILLLPALAFLLGACNNNDRNNGDTAAVTAADSEPYPTDVCVVSGEPLGSMGEPVSIQHEGREVRFCCEACIPKFKENPSAYLSKLDAAEAE